MSRLRVAIVGGGAAGLITAYLLHEAHEVTLFERAEELGGNVRTLGGNAPAPPLDPDLRVENGTLGFCVPTYPTLLRLLEHLGCEVFLAHRGMNALFADGRRVGLPTGGDDELRRQVASAVDLLVRGLPCKGAGGPFQPPTLEGSCGRLLPPRFSRLAAAVRGVLMIGYSTPCDAVDELPAAFVPWVLEAELRPWVTVRGGVFAYMQRILERMGGRARVERGAEVLGVSRDEAGVTLERAGAAPERFDRVVLATTPDRVLGLLRDPSPAERERFGAWEGRGFRTLAHHDGALYAPWGDVARTAVDVFDLGGGRLAYNTDLAWTERGGRRYGFAHGLEERLDPACVVDAWTHHVPRYTPAALATTAAIAADNGARHTYHVGAYLDGGLHEGAASSALAVSRLLGGRSV